GLDPVGYHVVNLLLHWLSALVLWGIIGRTLMLERYREAFSAEDTAAVAFLTALVWAVHPLQTETVQYVTQRTELMVGLCYFATLCVALRYWSEHSLTARRVWLAAATLACLAGAACKEIIVTAPLVTLLFERTFIASSLAKALRKSWPLYIGLL